MPYDKKLIGFDYNLPYVKEVVNFYDLLYMDDTVFQKTINESPNAGKENVLMDMNNGVNLNNLLGCLFK